ncbi:MAG TPA: SsrA-binding protein SmpB [Nitrospirota bacterium]|nr:SsrA-binding protein SmpB [Nitrospirota bacterium]
MPKDEFKLVTSNKKAFHDFFIEEKFEAGIALTGTEVKSLREGRVNLKDSYAQVKGGEVFLIGCHVSPYSHGNIMNVDPERTRKLLLHGREIKSIQGLLTQKGYTLVPLRIYFKGSRAKVELGLAKGKKLYDVREAVKEKEAKREVERAVRGRQKSGE